VLSDVATVTGASYDSVAVMIKAAAKKFYTAVLWGSRTTNIQGVKISPENGQAW
jgi:hypothetical protein